jgi:cytochrome c oxidase assembly factor CtaG
VSVALFNAAMIARHLPGPYDLAKQNEAVHTWLMHGTMFGAGVLFWLQFIPSPPFRRRMPLLSQAGALLGTNVVMIGIAMTLSIFTQGQVYSVYGGERGVTLPPFADQQISAAVDKILGRGPDLSGRPGSWTAWERPGALDELRAQPPSSPEAGP